MNYLEKTKTFDEENLLSLDEVVLWALELFEKKWVEKLDISWFKKPLIAGSWNAITTAKIIFSWIEAVFCDETSFDECINKDIDWLIIASASWEKHAIIFANKALEKWIKTKLLTCNSSSTTENIIWSENTIVTQKNREPYTYNTSTYLWWVLAYTWEKALDIRTYISENIDPVLVNFELWKYDSYLLVTPDKFSSANRLFIVKFIELFGRKIARDVCSFEHLKHAITVVPHKWELCISFWNEELNYYDWNHLNFSLPDNANLWTIMAIWYYVIWKIQNSHPSYFKNSIWEYIKKLNKTEFWKSLSVIVE